MVQVVMPGIGAGTTHGRILEWRMQEGAEVRVGDILAEIETDKAVIELEALDEGVLQQILVAAGDQEVAVGEAIAVIGEPSAAAGPATQRQTPSAAPAEEAPQAPSDVPPAAGAGALASQAAVSAGAVPPPAPATGHDRPGLAPEARRVFASPSARRLARLHGVDLADLQGSGPGGRIVRVDIERASQQAAPTRAATPAPAPAAAASPARQATAPLAGEPVLRTPHSSMRKTIARRLLESKQQVPHFYLDIDLRMDALLALRRQLNAGLVQQGSALKLTLNDLIVYIAGQALQRSPEVNVRWTDEAMERLPTADVSVAVATERGLITPVVRDVAGRRLGEVASELHALIERAHAGRLAPSEYEGGGLSVSNLGMYGVRAFSAIINPPQAAILAVGAVERRPVVEGDAVGIAAMMTATLSADHRAVDGAAAARFLAGFRDLVENPSLLLV